MMSDKIPSRPAAKATGCDANFGETMAYLERTQNHRGPIGEMFTPPMVNTKYVEGVDHSEEPKPTMSKIGTGPKMGKGFA